MSFQAALDACQILINFMKQKSFITPEQIVQLHQLQSDIKEKLDEERQQSEQELSNRNLKDSQRGMLQFQMDILLIS